MKKCKWAGDTADEYCKSCDGIKMMVEGIEKSCSECAGYEEGTEEVEDSFTENMNEPTTEEPPFETEEKPVKTPSKPTKTKSTNKVTSDKKESVKSASEQVTEHDIKPVKVAEEKKIEEDKEYTSTGVQVTALRYTSSATVKKGDNYYKFTAEEEWSTALYSGDIQDVREQLWAKLNSEVDKQIEDLNNM